MAKLPGTEELSFGIKTMSCSSSMKLLWGYNSYWSVIWVPSYTCPNTFFRGNVGSKELQFVKFIFIYLL